MNKTKSRYPSWWAYYHLARNAYFLLGIPCLLLYSAAYTSDLLDDNLRHSISLFILAYGCYFLLFIPPLWLYLRTRAKKKKVQQVVQQIKESSPFAPTSDYEQLSFSKSCYFGIDIKNGTMLYVRIYPNNVMDVIGLDIHNFTRTVAEDGKLEILLNKDLTGLNSTTYTTKNGDKTYTTTINGGGLIIKEGDTDQNPISITKNNITMGGQQVHNVQAGTA